MTDQPTLQTASRAQALSLAVFRICYGMVLFVEVCHLFYFRHFVLDPVPYIQSAPSLFNILLVVWLASILCIISGFQTSVACVINYGFTVLFLGKLLYPLFEYHVDYVYIGVNFLLMFVPVSDRLSIDSYRQPHRQTQIQPTRYYALHINSLLFIGIALVYADSVFFKFGSPMWRDGLGVWLPASLPQNTWFPIPQLILDQKWLMLSLGYLTLIFETTFPILMWWRRARLALFVIGVGLHLSIGLVFPIPLFGLAYLSLYLLLLPVSCWNSLDQILQRSAQKDSCETENQFEPKSTKPESSHWGTREKLTLATLSLSIVLQACLIVGRYPELPGQISLNTLKSVASMVTKSCVSLRNIILEPAHMFLGITDHAVFLDGHFREYKHLYSIKYRNSQKQPSLLPLTRTNGTPDANVTGRVWAFWCFRVNGAGITKNAFKLGIQRHTSFWASKNNVSLGNADFEILTRPVHTPTEWVPGHLAEQKQQDWKVVGYAIWRDHQFKLVKNIDRNELNAHTEKRIPNNTMIKEGATE